MESLPSAALKVVPARKFVGLLRISVPVPPLAYLPSFFGVDLRVTVAGDDSARVESVTGKAYDELKECVAQFK